MARDTADEKPYAISVRRRSVRTDIDTLNYGICAFARRHRKRDNVICQALLKWI